jgi:hypothetical protein
MELVLLLEQRDAKLNSLGFDLPLDVPEGCKVAAPVELFLQGSGVR